MIRTIYPVLMTEKLIECCQFYKTYFSFTETFSSDWYISLVDANGNELALIDSQHDTIPKSCRTVATGMILNVEVENATQIYKEILNKSDQIIIAPLRDEAYGQRHFMVQDPNGVMIDIIEAIPPDKEFLDCYKV